MPSPILELFWRRSQNVISKFKTTKTMPTIKKPTYNLSPEKPSICIFFTQEVKLSALPTSTQKYFKTTFTYSLRPPSKKSPEGFLNSWLWNVFLSLPVKLPVSICKAPLCGDVLIQNSFLKRWKVTLHSQIIKEKWKKQNKTEFNNAHWNCAFSCFVLIVYSHAYVVYMLWDK